MSLHVFAGPTVDRDTILAHAPDAIVHPPVAHGDLLKLDHRTGDIVLIIDGYYHQAAPVRHKEILHLISTGVQVVGCSSLGALRAAELHRYGMAGHGTIFTMYCEGVIDSDAEVAVAHLPSGGYRPLNVALVNVRAATAAAATSEVLTVREAEEVVRAARSIHYTQRSWAALDHLANTVPGLPEVLSRLHAYLEENPRLRDTKRQDALDTLDAIRSLDRPSTGLPGQSWQNELIYDWLTRFPGRRVDDIWVGHADVLRYQQIYSPDVPEVWKHFVLDSIGIEESDVSDFLASSRTGEIGRSTVERFLLNNEINRISPSEAIATTVFRSFTPSRGLFDLETFAPDLLADHRAWSAVAAALKLNDEVRSASGVRLVDRLSESALRRRLCQLWGIPSRDRHALTAAARDRGLADTAEATAAFRPFYLLDDQVSGGTAARRWVRT